MEFAIGLNDDKLLSMVTSVKSEVLGEILLSSFDCDCLVVILPISSSVLREGSLLISEESGMPSKCLPDAILLLAFLARDFVTIKIVTDIMAVTTITDTTP